jgi:TonB-linked SusC/RagA family outer membrane protein
MFLLLTAVAQGQSQAITGTVRSANDNQPLPGVTVQIKGSSKGTTTDARGNYRVEGVNAGDSIFFSFIGYEKLTVPANGRKQINVNLKSRVSSLDQLVVVGYGTQKKSAFAGSVSAVQNKNLDQIPVGRIETALIGKLSGVNISTLSSAPGAAPVVTVRGMGSISAGNNPLIVIDGVPGGSLGELDMNDIQSVEVLKDASSAAIYGSRGSGGVIIVTTKKGIVGKPQFSLNAYYGVNKPILHHDWMTGKEWFNYLVRYNNREFAWKGGDTTIPIFGDPRRPGTYQVNPIVATLPQTIWQDISTQTAPIQNYNFSVRGGTPNTKYYISASYTDEEGAIKTASYKKYSFRANLSIKVNNVIDIGMELNPFYTKQRLAGSTILNLAKYPPFVSPDKMDGRYPRTLDYVSSGFSSQASPFTFLYGRKDYRDNFTNLGRAYINLKFTNDLSLKSSIGSILNYNTSNNYDGGAGDWQVTKTGSVGHSLSINLVNENVLSYAHTFNQVHDINAILGASYQRENSQSTSVGALPNSFSNDIIETLNNAIINPSTTSSSKSQWGLISYFGRINYAYKEKYLLAASFRTDGSSRFGSDNKWGYFPSVSGAWRVSKEPFLKDVTAINELKLRASYGVTGNFNIGDFQYLGAVGNVVYSPDNETIKGIAQTSIENPALSWEKTKGLDFGLDLSLFQSRINFTFDYYDKLTEGMLYSVNIPALTGFTSTIENTGTVRNRGIDIEISTHNLTGAFQWNTSFGFSHNHNEVVDLGGVDERINTYWSMGWLLKKGVPMFSYYGYKMIGVFQNQEQIDKTPHLAGTKPGNPIIKDVNDDGKITPDSDRVVLGNAEPKYIMGLTNDFSWKGFDLSITIQASLGAKIFNGENENYQGTVNGALRRSLVKNEWWSESQPGDGKTPAASLSQLFDYNTNTDYYIENASYLNVRNVNLGYRFSKLARYVHLDNLRAYISVSNLLIIKSKDNHAYNPEGVTRGGVSGISSTPGFNDGSNPLTTAIVFGLNVTF